MYSCHSALRASVYSYTATVTRGHQFLYPFVKMWALGTKRFHTDFLSYKLSSFWLVIVIARFLFALDSLYDSLARSCCRIVVDQLWIINF